MRYLTILALVVAAAVMAGCKPMYYEGMPTKGEPHAIAAEEDGIQFLEVDGRPVSRPAFASNKLLLSPGRHELLTRYDELIRETDYAGDLEIDISVHYWSRFAHPIVIEVREATRYSIGTEADLPSTEIMYDIYEREYPPDYPDGPSGQINITVRHELKDPDDWRPIITRILPIRGYWKKHPYPTAEIKTPVEPAPE